MKKNQTIYFFNNFYIVNSFTYLVRNYYQFNAFTITKSFGYNLLKGNNPSFKVEGNPTYIENEFKEKI